MEVFFAEDRNLVRRAGTTKGNRPAGPTDRINRVVRDPGGEVLEAEDLESASRPNFALSATKNASAATERIFRLSSIE
ncbi:hypothetical protein DQ354_16385 [Arthrobacter sp. AQ5-06]|nr:hypothetical protein DQ354_16385 [Arthrobacter sp. AQ5-06]